jgi:hypothetical protein
MVLQEIHYDVEASSLGDGLLRIATNVRRNDFHVKDDIVFEVASPYGWHVMPSAVRPYPQELGEVECDTELAVSRTGFIGWRKADS